MPRIMAVMVLTFVFSSIAVAGIYTWTDAQGVVHFTDTPSPDKGYRPLDIAAPVIVPMGTNVYQQQQVSKVREQVQAILSSDRERHSSRDESKAKALVKKAQTCAGYRHKLARIQSQLRAGYRNSKGNSLHQKRRNLSQTLSRECILR